MELPVQPSPPRAINPRHLGLTRRQSFDPLSSKLSLSQSLSLGNLPSPTFGHIPAGQRSVPAVDLNRRLGGAGAFRSVSGPLGDGQRTPGGSLVVGAEIFGFGGPKGKDRWGNGSVAGDDTTADDDPSQLEHEQGGWPSEFEAAVNANKDGSARKGLHGLETSSADFTLSGLPRPMLKPSGSSVDLRSSAFASSTDVPIRAPSRPTLGRAKSGLPLDSIASPPAAAALSPSESDVVPSGSLSLATPPSVNEGPATAAPLYSNYSQYESPAAGEYFSQGFATGGLPRNGAARQPQQSYNGGFDAFAYGPPQLSPDDLAFGLQSVNLNGAAQGLADGYRNRQQQQGQRPGFGTAGSYGRDAPPARQDTNGYAPYFASPYMAQQNPYSAAYSDPTGFFQPQNDSNGGPVRRDSGPQQQAPWGLPHGSDYSPSALPSRHGSFSYSPALSHQSTLPYGLAPGAFGGTPLDQGTPVFQPAQLGQQHQIILGRGLRSSAEYVAPGPMHQPAYPVYGGGYGHGYGAAETMGRALRSATLEEFRTSRHRIWELSDLAGHIVEFSGDQLGSRHIQTKLDSATAEEKALVFEEILPNMLQLSTDVFANYVIQKFFEQGNQLQKTAMANVLEGHVLQLSLQMYGCRVVQKALEYVLVDQQVRLVKELDGHVLKCARDAQSNHVVQRALERVPSDKITFITDACVGQVHALATHPYGCRVLQRIFENCPPSQTRGLLDELHRYTQGLIQDQYGNYVIQWVIEKGDKPDRSQVIAKINGQVLALAQQKFASNVIEKCVTQADDQERSRLIDEVLAPAADGSSVVKAMLVHPYANYVMQKILHTSVGAQRDALFAETAQQLANLRKYSSTYSKHLITIEKLLASERTHIPY